MSNGQCDSNDAHSHRRGGSRDSHEALRGSVQAIADGQPAGPTREQVQTLLNFLPAHQRDPVLFAQSTELWQSNVVGLEWSKVDLDRSIAWIHAGEAKGKRAFGVPLNSAAVDILQRQIGKYPIRVFIDRLRPIRWTNIKAWRKALTAAGIEDFCWHGLRHTWASWLVRSDVPLNVLRELGGWESDAMVRRYAHLAPSQLAHHAERVAKRLYGRNSP